VSVRHRLPPSAFKFAVFALVCLVLLVGLAVRIGNISLFSHRHPLSAQLADVTGLASGDPVTIAGVPVGQVASIGVQRGHALVALSIDNSVRLHRSTDIGVRWQNVIGEKEIEIFPGKQGSLLPPSATIPLSHDVSDASVNAFLNSLGPLLSSINPEQANEFVENVSGALEGDNNKITTPQSDVLRVVVDLAKVGSVWKIADVTVLEGATPASTGSASGSAGSTVPGQ
jgi:phospholipid/cholesterol/gamma-HCH transport system substrate-binding protein